nr:hypothetical protein GCM10023233_25790 [Brevibacterium otitidis]
MICIAPASVSLTHCVPYRVAPPADRAGGLAGGLVGEASGQPAGLSGGVSARHLTAPAGPEAVQAFWTVIVQLASPVRSKLVTG